MAPEQVPVAHFAHHLEAKLDLGFDRAWTRELYAERGRPSIGPFVFFKPQLIMFFAGIRSDRQPIAMAGLNLAHRWDLGCTLDEALPDHSSLTRIRQRLGMDIFQRFFERVIDLCQEAGLVCGQELYVDATKVEANADLDSLVPRFHYEAKTHVSNLFNQDPAPTDGQEEHGADPLPSDGLLHLTALEGRTEEPPGQGAAPRWQLLEERRLDPHRPSIGT